MKFYKYHTYSKGEFLWVQENNGIQSCLCFILFSSTFKKGAVRVSNEEFSNRERWTECKSEDFIVYLNTMFDCPMDQNKRFIKEFLIQCAEKA